jgi:prevent-host-death family protein
MPSDVISLTDFKNDASAWIERLQSQPPLVLTQNGTGRAVVLSLDAFRQIEAEMALMARLMSAKADVAAGKAKTTEAVFGDARLRLAARTKSHS